MFSLNMHLLRINCVRVQIAINKILLPFLHLAKCKLRIPAAIFRIACLNAPKRIKKPTDNVQWATDLFQGISCVF